MRVNVEDEESGTLPIYFYLGSAMDLDTQSLSIINSEIHAPITDANFTMF
jgi:hypothetical protein